MVWNQVPGDEYAELMQGGPARPRRQTMRSSLLGQERVRYWPVLEAQVADCDSGLGSFLRRERTRLNRAPRHQHIRQERELTAPCLWRTRPRRPPATGPRHPPGTTSQTHSAMSSAFGRPVGRPASASRAVTASDRLTLVCLRGLHTWLFRGPVNDLDVVPGRTEIRRDDRVPGPCRTGTSLSLPGHLQEGARIRRSRVSLQ